MALTTSLLATNRTAGPIISNLSLADITAMMGDPQQRYSMLNAQLVKLMDAQPEGTRLELVLGSLRDPTGTSQASAMAQALQEQFLYGTLKDPATNEPVVGWPEYPHQIAWANDSTATLTLRWVKGQIQLAPLLWALLVGIVIGVIIIEMLHNSSYTASTATNSVSTGGIIGVGASGPTIFGVPVWPNGVLIGAGIALIPAGIGYYGNVQRNRAAAISAQRELERVEGGGY